MITLVTEDGTGRVDSNTYVGATEFGQYAEAHLYSAAYTAADAATRAAALVMAARTMDSMVAYVGRRATIQQAMEWPRTLSAAREGVLAYGFVPGQDWSPQEFEGQLIPRRLRWAQCEFALALFARDRTADPDSAGVKSLKLGKGAIEVEFDSGTTPPVLPPAAIAYLEFLGEVRGKSGNVRIVRVQ